MPARGQARDVEAQHTRGNALRAGHRDAEALVVFRELWSRTHEPRALARMALAEAALGRWVEAEAHLDEALGHGTDGWIRQNRASLAQQRRLIGEHVGGLDVRCDVDSAEVWINAARVATLPAERPLRVPAGRVTFDVRAAGYEDLRRTIQVVPGGEATRAEVALTRATATTSADGARAPLATGGPWVVVGIASLAGGAVGLGVGVAALVVRNGHVASFRDHGCLLDLYSDVVQTRSAGCRSEYDAGTSWEPVITAGFVAGGVLAVAGAVMLLAAPRRVRESPTAFGCGPGVATPGVFCEGRF